MNFRLCIKGLLCCALTVLASACQKPSGWAVYYGAKAEPSELRPYSLVVVDRLYPHDISDIQGRGRKVIAYVSVGEVTVNDPWFIAAQEGGVVGAENAFWKGSFTVDIRNPAWQQILFEQILPPLYARGFDGVMLDTLDSPLLLEKLEPPQVGMHLAAEQIITGIREAYPEWLIIQNRGYTVLEKTVPMLNYVLAESTFTRFDAAHKKHVLREEKDREYVFHYIDKARLISPGIKVLGLEYWDVTDTETIARLNEKMLKNKFLPYISTLELDKVHRHGQ